MAHFWYGAATATACGLSLGLLAGLKWLPADKLLPTNLQSKASDKTELVASEPTATTNDDLDRYKKAVELANQARGVAESAPEALDSVERSRLIQQERTLLQTALDQLATISSDSMLFERAAAKQEIYQQQLAAAVRQTTDLKQTFIDDIVQDTGIDPSQVHITLCQIAPSRPVTPNQFPNESQCRDHQGDVLLASPASLIKVPVAIALIEAAAADNVPLSTKVVIDPNNYTENAFGSVIFVSQAYSLREIMSQMIKKSDNISTNQLIDYLGYDKIQQILDSAGYTQTSVGHKLVGSEAVPTYFGNGVNKITTHELTAMMAGIYSQTGNRSIRLALADQQDQEIGYQALQDISKDIRWIGEKTGQNNLVIGTALALDVNETKYILSVALDNSGDVAMLRDIIRRSATHLWRNGSLI
ncbi:MAG: serine hydrolase [Phormidesmis sp.]